MDGDDNSILSNLRNRKDFRRHSQQHVQFFMPFYPEMGSRLKEPLRYLRKRSSLEMKQYTLREREMSNAVVPFVEKENSPRNLAKTVRSRAEKLGAYRLDRSKSEPSIVITGNPGSGKTIFSGMLFSELCEQFPVEDDSTLLIYSQLKDTESPRHEEHGGAHIGRLRLWRRIIEGINYASINSSLDIQDFRESFIPRSVKTTVIVIDSLDEAQADFSKEDFAKITSQLRDYGIYTVWLCRDRDYRNKELQDLTKEEAYSRKGNLIEEVKIPYLQPKKNIQESGVGKPSQWIYSSFASIPLLYTFQTNFAIQDESTRTKLHDELIKKMRECHTTLCETQIKDCKLDQDLDTKIWIELAAKQQIPVLTDLLSQFMIDYLGDRLEQSDKKEIYQTCVDFLRLVANDMMNNYELRAGEIDEKAPEKFKKGDSGKFPEGDPKAEKFSEAVEYLAYMGILSNRRGGKLRFTHRAFAEYVLWKFVDNRVISRRKLVKQDLFSWRKSIFVDDSEEDRSHEHYYTDLETLMNYTGGFLASIPPLSNPSQSRSETPNISPDEYGAPWKAAYDRWVDLDNAIEFSITRQEAEEREKEHKKGQTAREEDNVSLQQFTAVNEYVQEDRPIQLQGYPGTGKTYTGVEVILAKMKNQKSSSNALIVTLNEALSQDIKQDLIYKHGTSKSLVGLDSAEEILERITPLSLREIFQAWAPDLRYDTNLITEEDLKVKFKQIAGIKQLDLFRFAFSDYNHRIFSNEGKVKKQEQYLKDSRFTDDDAVESGLASERDLTDIAKKWHKEVEILSKKKLPIHKACMVLINRLRMLEGTWKEATDAILTGDNLSDIWEKISWNSNEHPTSVINSIEGVITNLEETIHADLGSAIDPGQSLSFYDIALVDEVQDLPFQAVILISYLSKNRSHSHDLIFVGDHAQALNYEDFDWNQFFGDAREQAKELIKEIPNKHPLKASHHLSHIVNLHTDKNEIKKLTQNWRNPSAIVESMKAAVKWDPKGGERKPAGSVKDIESMEVMNTEDGEVILIQTESLQDYQEKLVELFTHASKNAQISIVVCDKTLQNVIEDEMLEDKPTQGILREHRTEFFDTFTIKGLERPRVAILGGWMVSGDGDHKLIFDKNKRRPENPELNPHEIDRINRKMLVALSRAQSMSLVLAPPKGISTKQVRTKMFDAKKRNFIQLALPEITQNLDFDFSVFADQKGGREDTGLFALSEGIEFVKRTKQLSSSWSKDENLLRNMDRISGIVNEEIKISTQTADPDILLLTALFRELDEVELLSASTLFKNLFSSMYPGELDLSTSTKWAESELQISNIINDSADNVPGAVEKLGKFLEGKNSVKPFTPEFSEFLDVYKTESKKLKDSKERVKATKIAAKRSQSRADATAKNLVDSADLRTIKQKCSNLENADSMNSQEIKDVESRIQKHEQSKKENPKDPVNADLLNQAEARKTKLVEKGESLRQQVNQGREQIKLAASAKQNQQTAKEDREKASQAEEQSANRKSDRLTKLANLFDNLPMPENDGLHYILDSPSSEDSKSNNLITRIKKHGWDTFDPKENTQLAKLLDYSEIQHQLYELISSISSEPNLRLYTTPKEKQSLLRTAERIIRKQTIQSLDELTEHSSSKEFENSFTGMSLYLGQSDLYFSRNPESKQSVQKLMELMRRNRRESEEDFRKSMQRPAHRRRMVSNLQKAFEVIIRLIPASKGLSNNKYKKELESFNLDTFNDVIDNLEFIPELTELRLISQLPEFTGPNSKERNRETASLFSEYIQSKPVSTTQVFEKRLLRLIEYYCGDQEDFLSEISGKIDSNRWRTLHKGLKDSPFLKLRLLIAELLLKSWKISARLNHDVDKYEQIMQDIAKQLLKELTNPDHLHKFSSEDGETAWLLDHTRLGNSKNLSGERTIKEANKILTMLFDDSLRASKLTSLASLALAILAAHSKFKNEPLPKHLKKFSFPNSIPPATIELAKEKLDTKINHLSTRESGSIPSSDISELYYLWGAVNILLQESRIRELDGRQTEKSGTSWQSDNPLRQYTKLYPHLPYTTINNRGETYLRFEQSASPEHVWSRVKFDRLQDYLVDNIGNTDLGILSRDMQPWFFNGCLGYFWSRPCSSFGPLEIDHLTAYKILRSFEIKSDKQDPYTLCGTGKDCLYGSECWVPTDVALSEPEGDTQLFLTYHIIQASITRTIAAAANKKQQFVTLSRIYRDLVVNTPLFLNHSKSNNARQVFKELNALHEKLARNRYVSLFPKSHFDKAGRDRNLSRVRRQKWDSSNDGFVTDIIEKLGYEIEGSRIYLWEDGEFVQDKKLISESEIAFGTELGWTLVNKDGEPTLIRGAIKAKKKLLGRGYKVSSLVEEWKDVLYIGSLLRCNEEKKRRTLLSEDIPSE